MRVPGTKSCCYKCPKRSGHCHEKCPDYAAEREEDKRRLLEERRERESKEAFQTPAFESRRREALNNMK
ncbi:MAG: hypothetical protein IJ306_02505 [Oscillospiraceae bacterium]|nr:hypothetical protein [Oscillospiraceae bacterium]